MYFEKKEKKRSFFWVYIILFVAFIIWVMLDEGENLQEEYQVHELQFER
ncbi:hypothetical protein OXI21_08695 [Ignatzschineria sp. RMDPL8A]|nr:hypothetical protein [Ignatzschineria sp. RMDPL8A]MDG9730489.1 hypothetical protein [Ignatzschineria sp. RMDPL8A]